MGFGIILITKDRNWCLQRTLAALKGTELLRYPLVAIDNGSTQDDPREVLRSLDIKCEYFAINHNIGTRGARVLAHKLAAERGWNRYCYLQDDFELKYGVPWLEDTFAFMDKFKIQYCRLSRFEGIGSEYEHWTKGCLRVFRNASRWNCSHLQSGKVEKVGGTQFLINDRHYSDHVHIIDMEASEFLFGMKTPFKGPSVCNLVGTKKPWMALQGAIKSEFDTSVKHWLGYAMGIISATGVLDRPAGTAGVEQPPNWYGLFEHIGIKSASDFRFLPKRRNKGFILRAYGDIRSSHRRIPRGPKASRSNP